MLSGGCTLRGRHYAQMRRDLQAFWVSPPWQLCKTWHKPNLPDAEQQDPALDQGTPESMLGGSHGGVGSTQFWSEGTLLGGNQRACLDNIGQICHKRWFYDSTRNATLQMWYEVWKSNVVQSGWLDVYPACSSFKHGYCGSDERPAMALDTSVFSLQET